MSIPLFEAHGLSFRYPGRPAVTLPGLRVAAGDILGLAGPNGTGKSTLLRILAFLYPPSEGELRFDGRSVTSEAQRARLRRQVTLLPQEPRLLSRSVWHNVTYGLRVRGDKQNMDERAAEALDMVGLEPSRFLSRSWRQLSGGEAQRVALAARLVLRPRALILDEPTASLDAASAERIRQAALTARQERGTTLIIASHDLRWLDTVSDHVLRMGDYPE
ncbi:energy-coupling factor ABC transporter ATP-binding protein [Desulfocurvibacter africanus]|uniref:energy-coupling factor ABC transporter ATP-binding protein n=1 Tax=Desulfocurvibacter africanus TaxID=873 RepID=UPI0004017902|nr:ABC transporter ATP-binding protein [Desulfocurvibacter africanus]